MAKLISHAKKVEAKLNATIKRKVLESAVAFERILQEEFRSPKSGRIYGAETEVSFTAKNQGGEKQVSFGKVTQVASRNGRTTYKYNKVQFVARRGQQASDRTVKFVANKGKKWREGKKNVGMHRASAPGEAPAIWSGALRKSITHRIYQVEPLRWRADIGVSRQSGRSEIAMFLEKGTAHIKARPGWQIALAKFKAGYRVGSASKTKPARKR